MADFITYDNDTFKCIDCIPEYREYHTIYVAKNPHIDENGRQYQVVNTQWGQSKVTHPIYENPHDNGYLYITLPLQDGVRCGVAVHRLVMLTWCPLPINYHELQVNHLNERVTDNHLSNLELVTAHENCVWGTRLKRIHATKVKTGQTTRVVAFDTQRAKEYHFETIHDCARVLELDRSGIYRCLNGQQRQCKGFVFCREDGKTK